MIIYFSLAIVAIFVLLICFALAVASFSADNYLENLKTTKMLRSQSGISTFDFVSHINKKYFGEKISIKECPIHQDHYASKTISLSNETMTSNTLASLSIIAHELGHARQDFASNKLDKHWTLRTFGRRCGYIFMPAFLSGILLSLLTFFKVIPQQFVFYIGLSLLALSVFIFVFALILKYKEIKIEKEASIFALDFLAEFLNGLEIQKCKNFLDSARLTYWASLFKTMFGWTMLTSKNKMFK